MTNNILLPTDSSVPALVATIKAVEMAKASDSTLVVLNVIEQMPSIELERISEDKALRRCEFCDGISFAKDQAAKNKVPVVMITREGAVTGEILKAAEEYKVTTIVMGTSSPSGLSALYLGDVAAAVGKMAKCSVVIIKPTEAEVKSVLEIVNKTNGKGKAQVQTVESIIHTKQFRVGIWLFFGFSILYLVFTVLGTYGRSIMGGHTLGVNVGIVFGVFIIMLTIVMAVTFNWYAGRKEAEG
jgi:nucleotide-binding universal stress UspA family protein